jgi:hypothetical protein
MNNPLPRAIAQLKSVAPRFDADGHAAKRAALQRVAALPLRVSPALASYHDTLLFLAAHPSDAGLRSAVEREFKRIAALLGAQRIDLPAALENQGLPFADTVTRFSHDCVRWLLGHAQCRVSLHAFGEPRLDLNDVLRLTLPSLERGETTAGLAPGDLLDALQVAPRERLRFLVNELGRLDDQPLLKDHLFDGLDLWCRVRPRQAAFSKAGNRLPGRPPFFQRELLRRFDPPAVMNARLPAPRAFDADTRALAVRVIKNTMTLTARETDPGTFLDEGSLRVYDLERGLAVAIYGMTAARQLPLESYIGFTLFKNGLAVAYGGSWVLGPRAAFGMNIFEPFRGGESGYMMCQVLRVYRQAFGVRFFEVDAHQFGLDNPDGIASGAYWFYYRHGFRSLDAALARLAERERARMAARPGHRSSEETLLAFTGSPVALNFGGPVPMALADITSRVTKLVRSEFAGDRRAAEQACAEGLRSACAMGCRRLGDDGQRVLTELALVAAALKIRDVARLDLLARMVRAKPRDAYRYQKLLLRFFESPAPGARRAAA